MREPATERSARPSLGVGWRPTLVAALVTAVLVTVAPSAQSATAPPEFSPVWTATIQTFSLADNPSLLGIAKGPDGNIWVAATNNNVARLTPGGTIKEFPLSRAAPNEITTGPDRNLWFTDANAGVIHKLTTSGTLSDYPIPVNEACPECYVGLGGITSGPGENVSFTQFSPGKIGIAGAATGALRMLPVTASPSDLALGADHNLWFTDVNAAKIRKMTPSGEVSELDIPSGASGQDITAGPDRKLWFTEPFGDRIGRVDPATGAITEFPVPNSNGGPWDITAGPDGNLWFTESFSNRIARITPSGAVTEIHLPPSASSPYDITTGRDGRLWFTSTDKVGALDPRTLKPPARPCLTATKDTTLTRDIGPCKGDGILVTKSHITLNLHGHKVLGARRPRYGDFAGIHLLGVRGVKVIGGRRRGSVSGFDAGVLIDFGSRNTIKNLDVHHNLNGGDLGSNLGDGIVAVHSSKNRIAGNRVVRNGPFDGIGVLGLDSNDNTLQDNTVKETTDLERGQGYDGLGVGIIVNAFLEPDDPRRGASLDGNDIVDNVVSDNVSAGISNLSNTSATIRRNRSTRNGFRPDGSVGNPPGNGIGVQNLLTAIHQTQDLVQGNRLSGNSGDGVNVLSDENVIRGSAISANGDNGISIWGSANRIARNASTGNDVNDSGSHDLFDGDGNCDSNRWSDNAWGAAGFFPDCTSGAGARAADARSGPHAQTARPDAKPMRSARGKALQPAPTHWSSPQQLGSAGKR